MSCILYGYSSASDCDTVFNILTKAYVLYSLWRSNTTVYTAHDEIVPINRKTLPTRRELLLANSMQRTGDTE